MGIFGNRLLLLLLEETNGLSLGITDIWPGVLYVLFVQNALNICII
jgi:hypothetical protein